MRDSFLLPATYSIFQPLAQLILPDNGSAGKFEKIGYGKIFENNTGELAAVLFVYCGRDHDCCAIQLKKLLL